MLMDVVKLIAYHYTRLIYEILAAYRLIKIHKSD